MPSSPADDAVNQQRAALDATKITRENAMSLYRQILEELPKTVVKMREHGYPLYLGRRFEQQPARVMGRMTNIWCTRIGTQHREVTSRSGFARSWVEDGGPVAGVVFNETASKLAVVWKSNDKEKFVPLKTEADFLKLTPVELKAILELLKEMQKVPKRPVEDVDWIEPPKTEEEWHKPVPKPQP